MHASVDDIIAKTPDYAECIIPQPTLDVNPCAQVGTLKCPECDRTFLQAGPWKRHMRIYHSIPCNIEDLFVALRDMTNGYPICAHCYKSFIDLYPLRDHINRRVCLHFDPAKDCIVPICNRPDLRMHLRYRSIPGLLLNKALTTELSQQCAFSSPPIRKPYKDTHPQLLIYEPHCREQVRGLANLGSGKGICVLCNSTCKDVRTHECGVLLQLSGFMGQTYDPTHFPCMPVMMKALTSLNADDMTQIQPPDSTAAQVCDTDEPIPMEI